MREENEFWTREHELALVFLALAYGTDDELTEDELATMTDVLEGWRDDFPADVVQDVVMEALAIYLEDDEGSEVLESIDLLKQQLNPAERRRALEDIVRIAEADGVLLSTEQNLITRLAMAWEIRGTGERLIDQTTVTVEEEPAWSMLHDIGLMYVIVAHSTDNEISDAEITAMIARLSDWQPELEESEIRKVLREALGFYSRDPGQKALRHSVHIIRERLPVVHRLVLLDDLAFIAQADGEISRNAEEMLGSLSHSWGIGVRVNGQDEHLE
jgi:uncharacterized tellurite resistance protein B-like protein